MPVVDCYAERKFQKVMEDTWGHLRAKPNTDITGFLIFTHSLGTIHRFDGRYKVYKNGKRRFIGKLRKLNLKGL